MIRILFICHGNICRSPMAEFVLKDMVKKAGKKVEARFEIASAATSREELGCPVYPPARKMMAKHGIGCSGHVARQMTREDLDYYDMIICMDEANIWNMERMFGPTDKASLLLDYAPASYRKRRREVADPWYTGNFDATWNDVVTGCKGLLESLISV